MKVNYLKNNNIEIRVTEEGVKLKGFIPYLDYSEILFSQKHRKFFKEVISRGAFGRALNGAVKPKLLINHDYSKEIKTREFIYKDTSKGLEFIYKLDMTNEVMELLEEGISNMSFGFVEKESKWYKSNSKEYELERVIEDFEKILEFSILKGKSAAYTNAKVYIGENEEAIEQVETVEFLNYMKESIKELKRKEIEELKSIIARFRK